MRTLNFDVLDPGQNNEKLTLFVISIGVIMTEWSFHIFLQSFLIKLINTLVSKKKKVNFTKVLVRRLCLIYCSYITVEREHLIIHLSFHKISPKS